MKTTKLILVAGLFAIATSLTYAGPGPDYWAQRRAARDRAAATAATINENKAAATCCRVVVTQRPAASHKITLPVKQVECSGCPTMAAGEKCRTS